MLLTTPLKRALRSAKMVAIVCTSLAIGASGAEADLLGAEVDGCWNTPDCVTPFDATPSIVSAPGVEFTGLQAAGDMDVTVDFSGNSFTVTYAHLATDNVALAAEDMGFTVLSWAGAPEAITNVTVNVGNTLPVEACIDTSVNGMDLPCIEFTEDSIDVRFGFSAANSPFPGNPGWVDFAGAITRTATFQVETESSLPMANTNDIIVLERSGFTFEGSQAGGLIRVDQETGDQEVIAAGDGFGFPFDVAIAPTGEIFVINANTSGIVKVDPMTAVVSTVSSQNGTAIAFEASGALLAAGSDSLFRVDPVTGSSTTLSTGLRSVAEIETEADGNVLVAHRSSDGFDRIVRVDPVSGAQTIVSEGGSLEFGASGGLAVGESGRIFVLTGFGDIVEVNPQTGVQTPITTALNHFGRGLVIDSSGDLLAVTTGSGAVRVDPDTGEIAVVSSGGFFNFPDGIAVIPEAPAPSQTYAVVDRNAGPGGEDGIILIDEVTGDQTLLSYGGNIDFAKGMAVGLDGTIFVAADGTDTIVSVDRVTGAQTVLVSSLAGTTGMSVAANGDLLVGRIFEIVRINPITGETTVAANGGLIPFVVTDVAEEPNGDLLAIGDNRIVRIDQATGMQSLVAEDGNLFRVQGIAVEADGDLVVVQDGSGANVIRIDPVSGAQTVVSSGGLSPFGAIAIDTNGDYLVTDNSSDSLIRMDPVTGAETVVSSDGFFNFPEDVALVPVPEPNAVMMLAIGGAFLGLVGRFRAVRNIK
jgi:streptogramin lyase